MSKRRLLEGATTAALVATVGLVVAIATGYVTLVTTHGTSMLPAFHSGDLAVVWGSGRYHVGEIVAYHSPLLNITVLHRIVAQHGRLFTFKGDNNSFLDPLRLPASDIKGSLLLHIPRAGAWFLWLKEPVHLALVVVGLVFLLGGGTVAERRVASRHDNDEDQVRRGGTGKVASMPRASGATVPMPLALPLALPLVLALTFAAIAGLGWSRPLVSHSSEPVNYHQQVNFSYSAAVAPSPVYPSGMVSSGQPVFLNLVHSIAVGTHFDLVTTAAHTALTGTMGETVTLSNGDGWSRVLQQLAPVRLRSSQATTTVWINLTGVAQLVAEVDKATGVASTTPTIVVTPTITFRGTVLGQPVTGRYRPSLTFDLSSLELSVVGQPGVASSSSYPELHLSKTGSVYTSVLRPSTMTAVGRSVRVSAARWIGEMGLAVSVGWVLAVLGWALWRRRRDETTEIEARFGLELIGVSTSPEDGERAAVIDVVGMPSLARLAENYGSVLLDYHHPDGSHSYYVEVRTTIYRYRPVARPARHLKPDPARIKPEPIPPEPEAVQVKGKRLPVRPAAVSAPPGPLPAQPGPQPGPLPAQPGPLPAQPGPLPAEPAPVLVKRVPLPVRPAPLSAEPEPIRTRPEAVNTTPEPDHAEHGPVHMKPETLSVVAERVANLLREEAGAQVTATGAGRAASERKSVLAFQRLQSEQAFNTHLAEMRAETLAAEWRAAQLRLDVDELRSEAEQRAQYQRQEAEHKALEMVEEAEAPAQRASADPEAQRSGAEPEREAGAAISRRERIDNELADLRRAFDGSGPPLVPPIAAADPVPDLSREAPIALGTTEVVPRDAAKPVAPLNGTARQVEPMTRA